MEVSLLGPLEVADEHGETVPIQGGRPRELLALLALQPNVIVGVDRLVDELWGESLPAHPANALQNVVFKLRRQLGPARVTTHPSGYALAVSAAEVDAHRFEHLISDARAALEDREMAVAVARFDEALGLWRGPAVPELAHCPAVHAAATRWDELRLSALEDRFDVLHALGQTGETVPDLEAAIAAAPFRERLRGQLMVALYCTGRQADALRAFTDTRRALAELGLEPSSMLRQLEWAILNQDPSLDNRHGDPAPARHNQSNQLMTNLPPSLNSFVGRSHDLTAVSDALGQSQLVSLIGPGGCGKTRLAIELGRTVLASFPGGVWLVALETAQPGQDVAACVAAALGLAESDTEGQPGLAEIRTLDRAVARLRASTPTLVVLDNCEHLIDDVAQVAGELLAAVPGLRIVVTSREALRVPGEQVWPLPPLHPDDAVLLFLERARAVGGCGQTTQPDRRAIADLCQLVDHIPLAIELAAARTRAFTVHQLLERIDECFRLLTGGPRTSLPRQQTLRAMVDWSYDLLSEDEQRVFERLSVFIGGCELDAAEAVCNDDNLPVEEVDAIIGRLVDKSLLTHDGCGRYRMLATLARYGLGRLEGSASHDLIRDRHAGYYRNLAVQSFEDRKRVGGRPQWWWLTRLGQEIDNLRAALGWSITRAQHDTTQHLAAHTAWFWWHTGRGPEGYHWLQQALRSSPDTQGASRSLAQAWTAVLATQNDDLDVATALATEITHPTRGDPGASHTTSLAWMALAQVAIRHGDTELAAERFANAQAAHADDSDPWSRGIAATFGATAALLRTNSRDAERDLAIADENLRAVGDVGNLVLLLHQQSILQQATGQPTPAETSAHEALDIATNHGMRGWQATLNTHLGWLALQRDDHESAADWYRRALALARELALPTLEAAASEGISALPPAGSGHRAVAEAQEAHDAVM